MVVLTGSLSLNYRERYGSGWFDLVSLALSHMDESPESKEIDLSLALLTHCCRLIPRQAFLVDFRAILSYISRAIYHTVPLRTYVYAEQ